MGKLQFADGPPVCHNCDYLSAQKDEPTITWPADLWARWQAATRVQPELEILALFSVDDANRVTGLTIPKQQISQGECELLEQNGHHDGMIHSHHSMGAFFSQADKSTCLPNYRFNIVTSFKSDGEYKATERIMLPCGGMGFRDATVTVERTSDDVALRELVLAQCETRKPIAVETVKTTQWAPVDMRDYAEAHRRFADNFPFEDYSNGYAGGYTDNEVCDGCTHCEVYWPTTTASGCWFCRRPTTPTNIVMAMEEDWADAEEAVGQTVGRNGGV